VSLHTDFTRRAQYLTIQHLQLRICGIFNLPDICRFPALHEVSRRRVATQVDRINQ